MDTHKLRELLDQVQHGQIDIDTALAQLRTLPYEDVGDFARLDLHRDLRTAMPEVVFCEGKTTEQALAIFERLGVHHDRVLGTRVPPEMATAILAQLEGTKYDPRSRLLTLTRGTQPLPPQDAPYAMVVCGGTSDLPIAEEAAQVLEFLGHRVERAYDVGVAGLHRLLGELGRLTNASIIIAVAGMEGALASVVAGLVSVPVIGVPTSVGYGTNLNGIVPLLTMLNSCASGVAVVNIDNGYGAAVIAHLFLRQIHRREAIPAEEEGHQ